MANIVTRLILNNGQFIDSITKSEREVSRLQGRLKTFGRDMATLGASIAAPIVLAGTAIVKQAIEYESAFAGVRKTVDLTEQGFAKLSNRFTKMSQQIPVSRGDLAGIGEIAGQLGVQGVENLTKFTDTVARIAVSTNLTKEQAATDFARLANIMNEPLENIDRIGSAVVGLGNNFATTEAEISEFGLRLAGAGKTIGITTAEVLGIGTALSSVGIRAEAGGTAFSTIMIDMAAAASQGGDAIADMATVAGETKDRFIDLVKNNPAEALTSFVEGLGNIQKGGGDLLAVLGKLGIEEKRQRDAILRMANAGDLLRRSMQLGGEEFKKNTALTIESEKRFATTESKITRLTNTIGNLVGRIGETLLPALQSIVDGIQPVIEKIITWVDTNPKIVEALAILAGVLAAGGTLMVAIGGFAFLIGSLGVVGGPIFLAIAAIGGIVAALAAFRKELGLVSDSEKFAGENIAKLVEQREALLKKIIALEDSGRTDSNATENLARMRKEFDAVDKALDAVLSKQQQLKDAGASREEIINVTATREELERVFQGKPIVVPIQTKVASESGVQELPGVTVTADQLIGKKGGKKKKSSGGGSVADLLRDRSEAISKQVALSKLTGFGDDQSNVSEQIKAFELLAAAEIIEAEGSADKILAIRADLAVKIGEIDKEAQARLLAENEEVAQSLADNAKKASAFQKQLAEADKKAKETFAQNLADNAKKYSSFQKQLAQADEKAKETYEQTLADNAKKYSAFQKQLAEADQKAKDDYAQTLADNVQANADFQKQLAEADQKATETYQQELVDRVKANVDFQKQLAAGDQKAKEFQAKQALFAIQDRRGDTPFERVAREKSAAAAKEDREVTQERNENTPGTEEFKARKIVVETQKALAKAREIKERINGVFDSIAGSMKRGVREMVTGVLRGTQSIGDAFKNMGSNILLTLSELFVNDAIDQFIGLVKGEETGGGLLGGILGAFGGGGGNSPKAGGKNKVPEQHGGNQFFGIGGGEGGGGGLFDGLFSGLTEVFGLGENGGLLGGLKNVLGGSDGGGFLGSLSGLFGGSEGGGLLGSLGGLFDSFKGGLGGIFDSLSGSLSGLFSGGGGGFGGGGGLLSFATSFFNKGGMVSQPKVLRFAGGGGVPGFGNTDTVDAKLTPGEGVLSRRGVETLGKLNQGLADSGGSGPPINLHIVMKNVIDPKKLGMQPEDVVSLLQSDSGKDGPIRAVIKSVKEESS